MIQPPGYVHGTLTHKILGFTSDLITTLPRIPLGRVEWHREQTQVVTVGVALTVSVYIPPLKQKRTVS